jgi:hypothetical protein
MGDQERAVALVRRIRELMGRERDSDLIDILVKEGYEREEIETTLEKLRTAIREARKSPLKTGLILGIVSFVVSAGFSIANFIFASEGSKFTIWIGGMAVGLFLTVKNWMALKDL